VSQERTVLVVLPQLLRVLLLQHHQGSTALLALQAEEHHALLDIGALMVVSYPLCHAELVFIAQLVLSHLFRVVLSPAYIALPYPQPQSLVHQDIPVLIPLCRLSCVPQEHTVLVVLPQLFHVLLVQHQQVPTVLRVVQLAERSALVDTPVLAVRVPL